MLPFPVYYINMEQSSARRERVELDFGDIWDLRRSPAVDGMNAGAVVELMGQANYDEILPSLSEDRYPGTINGGELGCVLSHLTAIRRAYIDGNDMAMIVEDDITPLLMQVYSSSYSAFRLSSFLTQTFLLHRHRPFWTESLIDVVNEAVNYSNGSWEVTQTAWIWGMDEDVYDRSVHPFSPGRQVLRKRFQFGTSAYIVSKRGMGKILDAYFTDRTETGQIRLRKGGDQAELYIYGAVSNLYIVVPSFFTIEGSDTTISIGEESQRRLSSHRASNKIHIKTTFELYHDMKKARLS